MVLLWLVPLMSVPLLMQVVALDRPSAHMENPSSDRYTICSVEILGMRKLTPNNYRLCTFCVLFIFDLLTSARAGFSPFLISSSSN